MHEKEMLRLQSSIYLAYLNKKRRHDALASNDTVVTDTVVLKLMEMLDPSRDAQLLNLLKSWVPLCRTIMEIDMNNKSTVKYIPYSVVDEALRFAQEVNEKNSTANWFEQKCETLSAFLESVKSGEALCVYTILSPKDICQAFNQYSHVIWMGNSLTRHVLNALLMLITQDFQDGGIPMGARHNNFDNNGEYCQCK